MTNFRTNLEEVAHHSISLCSSSSSSSSSDIPGNAKAADVQFHVPSAGDM
jgi:hypothetical protein